MRYEVSEKVFLALECNTSSRTMPAATLSPGGFQKTHVMCIWRWISMEGLAERL